MLYNDKLRLPVVDLPKIDMATEEDRAYHIDYWASLFKAATWEEGKMLAQKDESIMDASNTIYHLNQEEKIRLQCEAREDYYRRQGDAKLLRERLTAALENVRTELAEKDSLIAEQHSTITALQAEIERLKREYGYPGSPGPSLHILHRSFYYLTIVIKLYKSAYIF